MKFDVHSQITNHIIAAIETAGEFQTPWITRSGGSFARPVNVASKRPYNGINILNLWIASLSKDYPSNTWGTYRQWQQVGCQVRQGEKSSLVVFYQNHTSEDEAPKHFVARASRVFNAAQVDGFELQVENLLNTPLFTPVARAEAFATHTGARIEENGEQACFVSSLDLIRMPERCRFIDTATTMAAEAFYGTLSHELVHWTGVSHRLDRDLSGRFGDQAYAMEELVAELGAAFLCSELGLAPVPREDHACYIKSWLAVLKQDKRAIFTAASKASQAAN
ncbi:ArdC family protein [Sulfitobacter brevis]|nr:zincin-like metallopeptidase domain-containing protein [Sulfitobacter brevis]